MALYLVTGGCGFIGSHLVDSLVSDGHSVRVLDDLSTGKLSNVPSSVEVIVGSVTDRSAVASASEGISGCFHLAAIASVARSNEDWRGTHEVNLTGAINVFDAARAAESVAAVPVVYASSAAVYGDNQQVPLTESSHTRPLTAYGADKLGCELHAAVAAEVHGVATTGFRFFNVYGPRQDPKSPYSGVISIFADRIRDGRGITIHGDGGQTRDFVFVADVVAHLRRGMETCTGGARVYNVCTGRETSVLELAAALGDVWRVKPEVEFGPARAGDIRRSLGAPENASRDLSVSARTELRDGLDAIVRWSDRAAAA